ncbi:MAG: GNAT family N-acetyltransferase [Alphaproteobacteria bacterium]|jgi:RimJ/RimL family protein N-acetyltransferase|nr:GNAT family N-acetyltransferase [Alphaproteobacteria bacterium]MDP6567065.1 GNAT family N-acetyltransferase [Alphaproteobacteria bacterium]MDP6811588.1 GNAT family N-acetyltransferase [Alphaproteobacteria bacterium]
MKAPFHLPLRTDNLVLRTLERNDAPIIARLAGDWEVARWTADIPHPYDARMAREFIAWTDGEFAGGRRYVFAIVARATGAFAGVISLTLNGRLEGEIGYWIGRPHQGQGLGREAARAVVALAFGELALRRVVAACLPENEPSWRVMAACGMSQVGQIQRWAPARRQTFEMLLYAVDNPAPEADAP